MSPEYYLKLLRRSWLILLVGTVVGAALGYGVALLQPKQYSANASGFVSTSAQSGESVALAVAGDNYAKSRATSYADLGTSRVVAESVIEELNLSASPESLVRSIDVTVPPDTVTIQVSAKASSPELAREIANAWVSAMSEQVRELESGPSNTSQSSPVASLEPLESAVLPTSPSSPNVPLYVVLAGFLGLAAALTVAVIKGHNDKRIRSVKDVEGVTDIAIIGKLPIEASLVKAESRLINGGSITQDARVKSETRILTEGLRDLRTNLEFVDVDNPPQSIVVTSALPGDGKSTVAANLAGIIAQSGKTVVLIDADLRKPTVAKSFNISNNLGLTDLLARRVDIDQVVHQPNESTPLYVIPTGTIPPNPSELLSSKTMEEIIDGFTKEGVTVILDAPPIIPVTDASVLAAKFDGAIIVASAGVTRTDSLSQAINKIQSVNGRILGLVLNRIPLKGMDKNSYGYYGHAYGYTEESKKDAK